MALATYLLAAAPGLIEGVDCQSGPSAAPVSRVPPAGESLPAGLGALLTATEWDAGPAVIVVAADLVGFRRLSFPFRDARRIRQALHFSLESELLDGVDTYAVDHDLILEGEGARALVSLLKQDLLQGVLQSSTEHGLQPYRVLSAAHALLAAHPAASPDHMQVYVGAEEAFATLLRGGQVDQIKVLPSALPSVLAELSLQGVARPEDVYRLLTGEADDKRINRSLLRSRLVNALEDVLEQIGRFLQVQGLPAATTVSLHGLYAPWIEVDVEHASARLAAGPKPGGLPQRMALGILEELRGSPGAVLTGKGPGFYRAAATWRGILAEVRRPAIACGVLVALMLLVAGSSYLLRTVSLLRQLSRTDQELHTLVVKHVGANVPESAQASVLRERLQSLREQARMASRTNSSPYAMLGTFTDLSVQAAAVPGVTVENMQISGTQVVLAGQTPSYQAAETLKDRLGAVPRFRGRTVRLTYQRAGQGLAYRVTVQ